MSLTLDTGAIKGWWRLRENIRHNREVPWETSPVGRHLLAPSHWRNFGGNTYLYPVLALAWLPRWVGRALNWQITQPSTDPLRSHIEGARPSGHPAFHADLSRQPLDWTHWLEINFVKITFSFHVDFSIIVSCTLKIYPLLIGSWNNANKLQTSSFLGVSL
mgnify:CR=1 FL=1